MAGDWLKMRLDLQTHPKVVRILSAMLPHDVKFITDKFRVIGGLHAVWSVFDKHSSDGVLHGYCPQTLDHVIGWECFSDALINVGWLVHTPGESLTLPEFSEHNGQSGKRRAEDQKRKREERNSPQSVRNLSANEPDKKRTREEKRREEKIEDKNTEKPKSATPPFVLPNWIDYKHWEIWHSTAKRKKATPAQKQMAVDKLAAWRDAGEDYAGALENAAIGGNQGLFLPSKPFAKTSTGETPYQKSMRERMSEFAPGIARRAPGQEFTDLESINVVAITRN